MSAVLRDLSIEDAASVARIYNEAVAKRLATFEESPAKVEDIAADLQSELPTHPSVGVILDGELIGYAMSSSHSTYAPYRGIAEFSVYVAEKFRGRGYGRLALDELIRRCQARGFTKLLSRILEENVASRSLCTSLGFREVGMYVRHAQLDGVWRNLVIVEKLL